MSQNPYTNDYSAPSGPQDMQMGNHAAYGIFPPAPEGESRIKNSQIVMVGTAVAYLLGNIFYAFSYRSVVIGADDVTGLGTFVSVSTLVGTAIGIALFALVYYLMNSRKKVGRITGYVFAGLGILSALVSVLSTFSYSIIAGIFVLLWLAGSIAWIVLVTHRSVSSILR